MQQHTEPRSLAGLGAILAAALLAACTTQASATPTAGAATQAPPTVAATVPPATPTVPPTLAPAYPRNPAPIETGTPYLQAIDPADFVAVVDNPFLPFKPGMKWVYDGDEHNEVTVLPDTKLILGVAATVVHDQVFSDGVLAEDTLDYYAQDRDGNVWYFGEKTEELDKNGNVTSTEGSWEGGVDGAQPGIVMLAVPAAGDQYRQEYHAGDAEDLAKVTSLTGTIKAMGTTYSGADVLVTEEWTPLEPGIRERKTYVRGIGNVETRTIEGGKELVTLTSFKAG
jgi:hypothetical protein